MAFPIIVQRSRLCLLQSFLVNFGIVDGWRLFLNAIEALDRCTPRILSFLRPAGWPRAYGAGGTIQAFFAVKVLERPQAKDAHGVGFVIGVSGSAAHYVWTRV